MVPEAKEKLGTIGEMATSSYKARVLTVYTSLASFMRQIIIPPAYYD